MTTADQGAQTETRTEWAVRLRGDLGRAGSELLMDLAEDEGLARIRVRAWRKKRPDVESILLHRTVTVTRGEWEADDA